MRVTSEAYPMLWSTDVERIVDWAVSALELVEAWRAPGEGRGLEHAELLWPGGRISINQMQDAYRSMGPCGIALRVDDRQRVDEVYRSAIAANAEIVQGPEESRVAYSFTARDPDGNLWWVNAETGFLDGLRKSSD